MLTITYHSRLCYEGRIISSRTETVTHRQWHSGAFIRKIIMEFFVFILLGDYITLYN